VFPIFCYEAWIFAFADKDRRYAWMAEKILDSDVLSKLDLDNL